MVTAGRSWLAALGLLAAVGSLAQPAAADDKLYQGLGGNTGILHIVDIAYSIILADDRVSADFDNINPEHIKPRVADLLCQLAGGPCVYRGRPMAAAHDGLDLTRAKFNAVTEDLQAAMQEAGIPYWTQNRLIALLAPMQRDIVTK
jgi:hemoglobin